jgi:putative transposase
MARKPRWQQRAAVSYQVMNRGHNREVVFATDADAAYFLGLLERYRQRFAVRLHHYSLMSNHFHLLVRCNDPAGPSPWMAGLLRAYVHYYHRRTGFVATSGKGGSRARRWRPRSIFSAAPSISSGTRCAGVDDGTVAVPLVE